MFNTCSITSENLCVQYPDVIYMYEPRHDKTNKMIMCTRCPAMSQISLGFRYLPCAQWVAKDPGSSESSLGAHAILLVLL